MGSQVKMENSKTVLCLYIIEQEFGDITKDIANVLLNSESSTLLSIYKYFSNPRLANRLSISQVRQALLVLSQHNCLSVELPPEVDVSGDTPAVAADRLRQKGLIYNLNLDSVVARMRFSKAVKLAHDLFGELGAMILEETIVHGRLRAAQIREDVTSRYLKALEAKISNESSDSISIPSPDVVRLEVQSVFERMVQRRLLVAVPPLDVKRKLAERKQKAEKALDVSKRDAVGDNAAGAKPDPKKKRKLASIQQESHPRESQGAASDLNVLPVELRLMLGQEVTPQSGTESLRSEEVSASKQGAPSGGGSRGGRGRGRGARGAVAKPLDQEQPADSTSGADLAHLHVAGTREDVLWRIGWDQYIREERRRRVVEFAAQRMEAVSGRICSVILEHSLNSEISPRQGQSAPLSVSKIYETLVAEAKMSSGGAHVTIDMSTLRKLLDLLRLDSVGLVSKVPGSEGEAGGPLYCVNLSSIVAFLQKKTVHSIAVDRYGLVSGRIVELLQKKRFLEQQSIADMVIVPVKDARERLYRLFKDKWVEFAEITKRPDFNPTSTHYFWYLDKARIYSVILNHLYLALHNLCVRRSVEFEAGRALLDFAITDATEAQRFDKFSASLDRLDKTILSIDDTVQLLHEF